MKKTEFRKLVKECVKSIIESEMSNYDPQTDTMAYEPRDRDTIEDGGSLQIPNYPSSILKKVNLDGRTLFFVYSDATPTALILGYSPSEDGAIENAKKTAAYIKQGGVGNDFGELKEWEIGNPQLEFNVRNLYNQILVIVRRLKYKELKEILDYLQFKYKH
jgi:hypothetical protein